MSKFNGHRDGNGRFAAGNPGGPGRPRRAVELEYLAILADAVPPGQWKKIVAHAVKDALAGDSKARRWLGEHLLGRQREPLTMLAVTEAAGTLDDDIRARAAGLRLSLFRKQVTYQVKAHPDLSPDRPSGSGDIGRTQADPPVDVKAPQPARNGHSG
jgi:hypothetical protein